MICAFGSLARGDGGGGSDVVGTGVISAIGIISASFDSGCSSVDIAPSIATTSSPLELLHAGEEGATSPWLLRVGDGGSEVTSPWPSSSWGGGSARRGERGKGV
jgi:hypothetical protein